MLPTVPATEAINKLPMSEHYSKFQSSKPRQTSPFLPFLSSHHMSKIRMFAIKLCAEIYLEKGDSGIGNRESGE
jgi:hypothetical protein